jgi:hypothetical protein
MTTFRAYSRKATKKDCKALAKVMRESDKKEVMASHGHTPYEALINSFEVSDFCISIVYRGKVLAMCGITSLDKTVGSPWLLGSEGLVAIPRVKFSLLRESLRWITRYQKKYPMLLNYVHAENRDSLMWLKYLGFNFIRKVEFSKEPFYEFVRIKEHV